MVHAVAIELPLYRSHKLVRAFKIKAVEQSPAEKVAEGGSWELVAEDEGIAPVTVTHEYVQKHNPQPGGYYVVYADGYHSFSPAEAFEEGNTLVPEEENHA